jgi:N-acyl-D-aspartate/D-glutamate deacylase
MSPPGVTCPRHPASGQGASAVGLKNGLQRGGQLGEVAVVDPAVVELAAKFLEQHRPVSTGRCGGGVDLNPALDDPDG